MVTSPAVGARTDGRVVLIVEDEEPIRAVITDVLRDRGFQAVPAANGAEALELLDTVRPDVVVLDLLMPVMHGWAFMESYFQRVDGRPIPIVVVSVNPALPRSFNRLGVKNIVAKPFDVDALLAAVEQAVETATP
ncbi:MAG TPA: response regulator [Chloroflexota bacterium]|nr:response regulator [Chloroflexota bacterium]